MSKSDQSLFEDLPGQRSPIVSFLFALPFAGALSFGAWWAGNQVGGDPALAFLHWAGTGTIVINSINITAFFIAILELSGRNRVMAYDQKTFDQKLLPEDAETVIDKAYIRQIFKKLNTLPAKLRKTRLAQAVELCASKYQTSQSVSEVSESVNMHMEAESNRSEGGYSLIKYLAWAIPSIGFIGTVMGLSRALGRFGGPEEEAGADAAAQSNVQELMRNASQDLMLAFNTTFVALVLAVLLMYYYHRVLRREDNVVNQISKYCLKNFITKAYFSPPKA